VHLFLKFVFGMKLFMFRTIPLTITGVFHCTYSNVIHHTGLLTACKLSANLYDVYHCCAYSEKLLWWTEELSETCRVSFQKYSWEINASSWFCYKKFITTHGHM